MFTAADTKSVSAITTRHADDFRTHGCRCTRLGFTSVELTIVLLLMATMAVVAVPRWTASLQKLRVSNAANRIVADFARVQSAAYNSSSAKSITFTIDSSQYTVAGVQSLWTQLQGRRCLFFKNALRSGSTCAPIRINLQRQYEGTQTLTLATKTSDVLPKSLLTISGLPSQSVWLHLIIDPISLSVNISLNGVQYGTYALSPFASTDSSQFAAIGASGSSAEFSWARVRVLEQ